MYTDIERGIYHIVGQFDLCNICLFQGREASSSQASKDEANDKRGDKTL